MLGSLAELLPARSRCVLIDGPADQAELFAARLAEKLGARRRPVQLTLDPERAQGRDDLPADRARRAAFPCVPQRG